MSYADIVFKDMCTDIIENGISTEGEKVRPHWEDTGEPAYTIKKFGVVNRYDLSKEFPALTLRKTGIKSCTDELLWIWQKKSNKVSELNSHVWDEWEQEDGTIGKAYGYQMQKMYHWPDVTEEGIVKAFPNAEKFWMSWKKDYIYPDPTGKKDFSRIIASKTDDEPWMMNQVDKVIYDLINTPFSRRIITNMYNFHDLHEMALYPCAYSMTFNVTTKLPDGTVPEDGKLVLNGMLNQRSQDILAANNWNVCQYSVLIHMFAQVCGMVPGEFVHVISDAHIYDRHVPIIKELIERESLPAPKFWLNPEITDFYDFTKDDVILIGYEAGPQIKNIPIAV